MVSHPIFSKINDNPGPSNLFALIIGINIYDHQSINNISGATSDVQNIFEFLKSLGVPECNICTLTNERATRDQILNELSRLATDSRIRPKDNTIFIYFAGHGATMNIGQARASCPPNFWSDWHADDVEMLCPCDIGIEKNGVVISGIPDKIFACYLNRIAKEKGDNIVVMLDCCYSASITRSDVQTQSQDGDDIYTYRYLPNPPSFDVDDTPLWSAVPLPSETDVLISMQHKAPIRKCVNGFEAMYNGSHILLAACGRSEKAHGTENGGLFTTLFLRALGALNDGLDGISYRMLFTCLPKLNPKDTQKILKVQTPHCSGRNVGREIFSLEVAEQAEQRIQVLKQDGRWIMMAGQAHGVEEDTTVRLFTSKALRETEGHPATIMKIGAFRSEVELFSTINAEVLYAQLRHSFALTVFVSDSILDLPNSSIPSLRQSSDGIYAVCVPREEDSHLILTPEISGILVELNAALVAPQLKNPRLFTVGRIKGVGGLLQPPPRDVFQCASHFMYHLLRPSRFIPLVSVELYVIKRKQSATQGAHPVFEKFGENVIDPETNLAEVDGTHHYGITLKNNDSVKYYPYIVSFDADLEAHVLFEPQFGINDNAQVDDILYPGETRNLWDGGKMYPLRFTVERNKEDFSMWKILLTTQRIDILSLTQASIFNQDSTRRGSVYAARNEKIQDWGSVSVAVVQKWKD